jgi:DNA-binding LacI/PurR family transcriptional regulator
MAHSVHMMGEILDRLAERGYERVGYLTLEDIDLRIERGREMVWDHRQAKIPRGRRIPAAFVDGWRPADLAAWLEKKRPDALVLGDPGLLRVLDKTGWKAPVALGVATTRWSKAELRCAGMRQPFGELGAAAVDLVVGQIHRNEAGLPKVPVTVMVDGEWIEGASLPPRRHRANAG